MIFLIEKIWKLKGVLFQLSYESPPEIPPISTEHMQADALFTAFQQEIGLQKCEFDFLISNLTILCGFLNVPEPLVSAENAISFRKQLANLETEWADLTIGSSLRLELP